MAKEENYAYIIGESRPRFKVGRRAARVPFLRDLLDAVAKLTTEETERGRQGGFPTRTAALEAAQSELAKKHAKGMQILDIIPTIDLL